MWSEDKEVHAECAAKILAVASEPDPLRRYSLALKEIAAGTATLPEGARRSEWAGTMAMAALHPDGFLRAAKGE